MDTLRLEQINNKELLEKRFEELESIHRFLGISKDEYETDILFGSNIVKCGLEKWLGNTIRTTVYLENKEYILDNLSLEDGLWFRYKEDTVLRIRSLKENTRDACVTDPTFLVNSLEAYTLDDIEKYKFYGDKEVTLRCMYIEYIQAMRNRKISHFNHERIDKISIKLNYELLSGLQIYFIDKFFKCNETLHKIEKILHIKSVSEIYFFDDNVRINGSPVKTGPYKNKLYKFESRRRKDKKIISLLLEYTFEELKRNFKEFGIEVKIIWEE